MSENPSSKPVTLISGITFTLAAATGAFLYMQSQQRNEEHTLHTVAGDSDISALCGIPCLQKAVLDLIAALKLHGQQTQGFANFVRNANAFAQSTAHFKRKDQFHMYRLQDTLHQQAKDLCKHVENGRDIVENEVAQLNECCKDLLHNLLLDSAGKMG